MNIKNIEELSINTIRTLSIDAIQKANSGHPGAPMGLATVGYCLWQNFLNYCPEDPDWPNRDRFILSNGHASMLLYSLLHLSSVKDNRLENKDKHKLAVSLNEIKSFRQLNSKCPGHPEYKLTKGIETTTGPLAQGLATSIGMAIANKWMKTHFNKPKFNLINYNIYVLCGDGCLMEGLSHEAASLAGHLSLNNLCWVYDRNNITIEGNTNLTFSENIQTRFESYGWNVNEVYDANNLNDLRTSYNNFLNNNAKPTLIIVNSKIGFGSPNKEGLSIVHGAPLGEKEVELTKKKYKWPNKSTFKIPSDVLQHFKEGIYNRGIKLKKHWSKLFNDYKKYYPNLAKEFHLMQNNLLPTNWDKNLKYFKANNKGIATRITSGKILNILGKNIPWLMGGSADLSTSTKAIFNFSEAKSFSKTKPYGRNLHFGIRENCMASILNGLSLSNIRAYGSTFLTFMDYLKPGLRLSALMKINPIYIFTHDSIGVGEDGPTHQPIEHLANLRSIPGLITFRPADANEVVECWRIIIKLRNTPSALILTRQNIPIFNRTNMCNVSSVSLGGYTLLKSENPDAILIATGSEVSLCVEAFYELKRQKINVSVVSIPSFELFEKQNEKYKNTVIPKNIKTRIAIEQASSFGWERYVGQNGNILSINTFGKSAPLKDLQKYFGFNVQNIVKITCKQIIKNKR